MSDLSLIGESRLHISLRIESISLSVVAPLLLEAEGALLLGNGRVLLHSLLIVTRSWGSWQHKVGKLGFLWASVS